MPIGTLFVAPEWHMTDEGENALESIKYRQWNIRKPFYLLERPLLGAPYPDVFEYKLFLSGKQQVGKSFLAAQLSATPLPHRLYQETIGINRYTVYWPARIAEVDRTVLFKLNLWDVSESGLRNFDHLATALMEDSDGVLFVFSFTDKSSLTELPHRMTRVVNECAGKTTTRGNTAKPCSLVVGTKLDLQTEVEVTQTEVADFESNWSVKVLTLGFCPVVTHTDPSSPGVTATLTPSSSVPHGLEAGLQVVASSLNYICDQLWIRDQIQAGKMSTAVQQQR